MNKGETKRGICSIDPNDEDYKDIIKKCKTKVGDTSGSCDAMQIERSPKPASGKLVFQQQKKPKHLKQRRDSVVLLKHMNPRDKESNQ